MKRLSFIESRAYLITISTLIILDFINIVYFNNHQLFLIATLIYIVDYVLSCIVFKNKYALSFWGIFDFYLIFSTLFSEIRFIKIFRLLRFLKVNPKLNKKILSLFGLDIIVAAITRNKTDLIFFLKLNITIFIISSFTIFFLEHNNPGAIILTVQDGIWWTFETMTTVGYGDMYPVTTAGRAFAMVITFVSLGIVIIPSTIIGSAIVEQRREKLDKKTIDELLVEYYKKDIDVDMLVAELEKMK